MHDKACDKMHVIFCIHKCMRVIDYSDDGTRLYKPEVKFCVT